jgi:hypothetical protein
VKPLSDRRPDARKGDGFGVGTTEAAWKERTNILALPSLACKAANDGREAVESYGKQLARLKAQYASAGYEFHELQAGTFIVVRWGMHRVLRDLLEAEKMLAQIGDRHG